MEIPINHQLGCYNTITVKIYTHKYKHRAQNVPNRVQTWCQSLIPSSTSSSSSSSKSLRRRACCSSLFFFCQILNRNTTKPTTAATPNNTMTTFSATEPPEEAFFSFLGSLAKAEAKRRGMERRRKGRNCRDRLAHPDPFMSWKPKGQSIRVFGVGLWLFRSVLGMGKVSLLLPWVFCLFFND